MTNEEASKILNDYFFHATLSRCNGKVFLRNMLEEAAITAFEALAKMEVIQEVIDMPFEWEQDDRRRYSKVVDIVRKDLTQEEDIEKMPVVQSEQKKGK